MSPGRPAPLHEQNNADWAPTQRMGHSKIKQTTPTQLSRNERNKEREARRVTLEAANVLLDLGKGVAVTVAPTSADTCDSPDVSMDDLHVTPKTVDAECQTDLTAFSLMEMEECINNMTLELSDLKQKLMETDLKEESFRNSDEKTKFYTGVPNFLILQQILDICSPFIYTGTINALSQFQELLLTLMRLRLNLCLDDLAYRFKISKSTASRIFDKWIDVLNVRLGFLIVWPDRLNLIEAMPNCFKQNYGNRVAVIIDCFEVFINRPQV